MPAGKVPEDGGKNGPCHGRQCGAKLFAQTHRPIAIVTAEQFISSIATERHFHMLSRFTGEVIRRQGRRIPERLTKRLRDLRQVVSRVGANHESVMIRP